MSPMPLKSARSIKYDYPFINQGYPEMSNSGLNAEIKIMNKYQTMPATSLQTPLQPKFSQPMLKLLNTDLSPTKIGEPVVRNAFHSIISNIYIYI